MTNDPLRLFNFMFTNNICTKLPGLYTNWAWELEQIENYKKAELVFQKGLEKVEDSEGKDSLEKKRSHFQSRVIKKLAEKEAEQAEAATMPGQEERAVLGTLRGHGKKQTVGSIRVGGAKRADGPGVLASSTSSSNASGPSFGIYQDENTPAEPSLPFPVTSAQSKENVPFSRQAERENEKTAGRWNQARLGKKTHAVPLDQISAKTKFTIHQDENVKQPMVTPNKVDSKVLSTKKVNHFICSHHRSYSHEIPTSRTMITYLWPSLSLQIQARGQCTVNTSCTKAPPSSVSKSSGPSEFGRGWRKELFTKNWSRFKKLPTK